MELGKVTQYNITIQPSGNKGFVVTIGCGMFSYETVPTMLKDLRAYLNHPKKWENEFNKASCPEMPLGAGNTATTASITWSDQVNSLHNSCVEQ